MKFDNSNVDYSLYLVTDNEMIPEGLTIYDQVEKALRNGVTVVQLREKKLETKEFIDRAREIHELTSKYQVPLIINDRVDVALAIDAEGVHVGQDDMDYADVRQLIGNDKLLGVSCSSNEEVLDVVKSPVEVDYIGIGPVYDTNTKKLEKKPFGITGIRGLLKTLKNNGGIHIKSVIIGGLNKSNIQETLYHSSVPGKSTDGVAVVSCIMAERDAALATRETLTSVKFSDALVKPDHTIDKSSIVKSLQKVAAKNPLVHHITNDVVKNFSANVTIAVGGSPVMSELDEEFDEFAQFANVGLLLNTGTPTEDQIQMYIKAINLYNKHGSPIVYDPVGCGSSLARRKCLKRLLNQSYISVIKGNSAEILTAAGEHTQMRGVDGGDHSLESILGAASSLALAKRCVVVVTGKQDIVVDCVLNKDNASIEAHYCIVSGGHELMGKITGSGCSLGSVITAFVASDPSRVFEQTLAAIVLYKQAGYNAAMKSDGPGTFMIKFLDELYELSKPTEEYDFSNTNWT